MRHRKKNAKLGRNSTHLKATLRNMATALFTHERITTTQGKAKALRPVAEKLITLGKRGDLHARRQVARFVREGPAITACLNYFMSTLFSDLPVDSNARPDSGGYAVRSRGKRVGSEKVLDRLADVRIENQERLGTRRDPVRARAQEPFFSDRRCP